MPKGSAVIKRASFRPIVKWHGGKHYLASRIIEHFPDGYENMTYVEPYGGAASVLLKKKPSKVEAYNDLDERIVNLFRICRDQPDEFRRRLALTPYAESELTQIDCETDDEIEKARQFYVQCRQSMGGRGTAFSASNRSRGGKAGDVNAWLTSIEKNLPRVIDRFRSVQIHCGPALDVIRKYDGPETLFYLDPPYVHATRAANSRDIYSHEMSEEEHVELLELLSRSCGRFVLSGYNNSLYLQHAEAHGWRTVTFDIANHAASGSRKERRTECLWINFQPPEERERV